MLTILTSRRRSVTGRKGMKEAKSGSRVGKGGGGRKRVTVIRIKVTLTMTTARTTPVRDDKMTRIKEERYRKR